MSDRVLTLAAQGAEATRTLPMPPIAFGLIAFGVFLVLLGITWSFRNTAYKIQAPTHVDQHGRIQIEGHTGTDGHQH